MIFFIIFFLLSKEPEIRVLIGEVKEAKIRSEEKIYFSKYKLNPPLTVKIKDGNLIVFDFCEREINGGKILNLKPEEKNFLNFEGVNYRGSLILILDKNKILVINKIPLEDYLLGVVPKEMGPRKYPSIEALKAQAVVARSYGIFKIKKPMNKFYDICSTAKCQVYGGASAETEISSRAVNETKGLVLVDEDGAVVEAFYMATCGGHTSSGEDIFPLGGKSKKFPSKECFFLPSFEFNSNLKFNFKKESAILKLFWNNDLKSGIKKYLGINISEKICIDFLRFLKEKGSSCSELFSLPIFKDTYISYLKGEKEENLLWEILYKFFVLREDLTNISGIFSYSIEDKIYILNDENPYCFTDKTLLYLKRGENLINVESLRLYPGDRLNLTLINGNLYSIEKEEPMINEYADGRAEKAKWIYFLKSEEIAEKFGLKRVEKIEVIKKSKEGRVLKLKISDGKKEVLLERLDVRFKLGLPEILFEILKAPGGYFFYGGGWGHGVGLCQEGAFGMASFGFNFEDILKYYYPYFSLAFYY